MSGIFNTISAKQLESVEIAFGVAALLSITGSTFMIVDIVIRMIKHYFSSKHAESRPLLRDVAIGANFAKDAEPEHNSNKFGSENLTSARDIWILYFYGEVLVLSLALSDLGAALWYAVVAYQRKTNMRCTSRVGFIGTIFEPSSVLWVCCISTSVYLLLIKSQRLQTEKQLVKSLWRNLVIFNFVSWLLPLGIASLFLWQNVYGPSALQWCWVKASDQRLLLYMYYIPILVAFLYNIMILLAIWIHNRVKKLGVKRLLLLWYIPVFLFVWSFSMINDIYHQILKDGQKPSWILQLLASATLPLQGFFNTIIWTTLLRSASQKQSKEEELFYFGGSTVNKASINLFGHRFEWFLESA